MLHYCNTFCIIGNNKEKQQCYAVRDIYVRDLTKRKKALTIQG
jgi:hypothetical protein